MKAGSTGTDPWSIVGPKALEIDQRTECDGSGISMEE